MAAARTGAADDGVTRSAFDTPVAPERAACAARGGTTAIRPATNDNANINTNAAPVNDRPHPEGIDAKPSPHPPHPPENDL